MKGKLTIVLGVFVHLVAIGDQETSVTLYQLGSKGKYCLSLTKDEGGCISGMDQGGQAINLVDVTRGKKVRFENLSDAPHDMRITGANAENMPAQDVGADAVYKKMAVEDRTKQSITCSFHGNQLGVGYRVLDDVAGGKAQPNSEHRDRSKDGQLGADADASGEIDGPRPIVRTGLADVGREVMGKGKPEDVAKLVAVRPDLMDDLKKVRPLLAEEIAAKLDSDGKVKVVAGKEGEGEAEDGDEYAEEFGQGEGALSLARLAALTAGQGLAPDEIATVEGASGAKRGSVSTVGGSRIEMDDDAEIAAGSADGVAGSNGRPMGAKNASVAGANRKLASVGSAVPVSNEANRANALNGSWAKGLPDGAHALQLLLLLGVVAGTGWFLYLALFAKRNRKEKRVS